MCLLSAGGRLEKLTIGVSTEAAKKEERRMRENLESDPGGLKLKKQTKPEYLQHCGIFYRAHQGIRFCSLMAINDSSTALTLNGCWYCFAFYQWCGS